MSRTTSTFDRASGRGERHAPEWALTLAFDCERVVAHPLRLALADVETVEIGRGDAFVAERAGRHVRLALADRWVSQSHARLFAGSDGWTVEDAGAKNGIYVNQRRVERALLADGDVLECGGVFFVLRRAPAPLEDRASAKDGSALMTLAPAFERELSLLPKIARARLPVLVRGESGTGKEVIANAIHALSGRSGPMVAVNCGAIPAALVESELFGSRRGAFSGAEDRPGLVRGAEGGTLFLDEVAELPLESQAALLRLLQEREVLPLGAARPVTVDVRVLAATHQPLEELLDSGRFRRDLYARLRGYEVRLPGLRERLEDLGLLTRALLRRIEPDRPLRSFSRAAARALFAHPWPLHVRELEQALRAAVAVANGPQIESTDLRLRTESAPCDDPDRQRLLNALRQHGGNLSAVARALVTSRTQVQRLLRRHALDPAEFKRR